MPKAPDPSTDLLEDTLTKKGMPAEPQKGMLTPEQMEAKDAEARKAEEEAAHPGAKEEEAKVAAAEAAKKEVAERVTATEALQAKIERDEALTGDEQAFLKQIEKELETAPAAAVVEKKYKIGEKEFTETELEANMCDYYQVGEVQMSDAGRSRMIKDYVRAQNRSEQAVVQTDRAEAQAALGKGQTQRAEDLRRIEHEQAIQRATLIGKESEVDAQIRRSEDKLARIGALLKDRIDEADIENTETGKPDYKKLAIFNQQQAALAEVEDLTKETDELKASKSKISTQMINQEVSAFTAAQPQYKTKGEIFGTWEKYVKGEPIDPADRTIIMELHNMMIYARENSLPLADVHAYRRDANQLAIKPSAAQTAALRVPAAGSPITLTKAPKSQADLVRKYKARLASSPDGLPAGGGGEAGKDTRRPATKMVEESAAILGAAKDPFLEKDLGF